MNEIPIDKSKIYNKLRDYRRRDKKIREKYPELNQNLKTIKVSEAIEIISKLNNNICIGCGDTILFSNYTPWCLYQFTFDRLDNKIIHCKNNLRVICYDCNATEIGHKKLSCSRGCHTVN